jgi:hypothetical protein
MQALHFYDDNNFKAPMSVSQVINEMTLKPEYSYLHNNLLKIKDRSDFETGFIVGKKQAKKKGYTMLIDFCCIGISTELIKYIDKNSKLKQN